MLRICLSASFTQCVTVTQVQELMSDFNPESEFHKNEDSASLPISVGICDNSRAEVD